MKKSRIALLAAVFLITFLIAASGGYWYGNEKAISRFEKEEKIENKVDRSDLEIFEDVEGPIYVTGHKSPDSDTVGSAIAYADLLNQLGFDARPVILEDVNPETEYILEKAEIEKPMILENAAGCNMVLVDHSEYAQSADGLEDAKILAIIDHHGDGDVRTGNQLIYDSRPLGATATIIWIRYRNYGLEPDKKTAFAMMGAILSDTGNLTYDTTTEADRRALKDLSRIAGVSDLAGFYRDMYKASISYKGMTDEEIFFSDYKEYTAGVDGDKEFAIGCINVYDDAEGREMSARMAKVIPGACKSTGIKMTYAQISIYHDDISITYLVPSDKAAEEVIKKAYGGKAVYDGTAYRLQPGVSRKTELVPAITDVLNKE